MDPDPLDVRWPELDALLDRALELDDGARTELLDRLRSAEPELVAAAERMLAAAERASDWDGGVAAIAPQLLLDAANGAAAGTPARLGAWRLLEPLGEGGMGEVFLAERDDGQFRQRVAIKLLHRHSPRVRERFERERQILADLRHEHIARLLDGGVSDDGRPFIVLEYVAGSALVAWCAEHRVGREARLRLLLQACEAVQHAHRAGVIHRDLKPSNLLVHDDAERGPWLAVLDFGVAHLAADSDLTVSGEVIGTPGYMAPEQIRGELESIDRRSDVYSLGVVLFELLCGRRPFAGETSAAIFHQVLTTEPPAPRSLVPDLPRDLETIVRTCLEREPSRRYDSVRALADDLERFLAGEPIAARPAGFVRRARSWIGRHPLSAATAAALLLALAVGGAVAGRGRQLARERAELARRFGGEAERIAAEARFERLAPLHDGSTAHQRLTAQLAALERELDAAPEAVRAVGLLALGRGRLALGESSAALADLRAAWQSGLETPESAAALAEAEVEQYRIEREAALQFPDPGLREARLAEIAARSRERALELAAHARSAAPSAGDFLVDARIARLEGDLDRADELATRTAAAQPWRYEAEVLVGDVALDRAEELRRAGRLDAVDAQFEAAADAWERARAIGRSDPVPALRLCAAAQRRVSLALHELAGDADAWAARGLAACRAAAQADAAAAGPFVLETALRIAHARDAARRGRDPRPEIAAAVAAGERATAHAPDSAEAFRRLGEAWTFRADFESADGDDPGASLERAAEALARATRLAPADARAWNSLGLARWSERDRAEQTGGDERGTTDAARAAFARAVELEPRFAYAWANLGTMHNKLAAIAIDAGEDAEADLTAAEAALARAIEIYPRHTTAINSSGGVAHNRGDRSAARGGDPRPHYRRALERFEAAIAHKPDWAIPRFNFVRSSTALARAELERGGDPAPIVARAAAELDAAFALRAVDLRSLQVAARFRQLEVELARATGADPAPALAALGELAERIRRLDAEAGRRLAAEIEGLAAHRAGGPNGPNDAL